MKQILVCYKKDKKLTVRCNILTDVFVPVQDIISPQKTTLKIPKSDLVQLSDIIIIKDNNSGKIEFIGYIDTLVNREYTEMSCYPLINLFDNEFELDKMYKTVNKGEFNAEGVWVEKTPIETEDVAIDAGEWIKTQIERAFVYTDDNSNPAYNADIFDPYQALPFKVENKTKFPVLYKKALDTANLLEVYIDLFISTGLYVDFTDLLYEKNEIIGIKCEIKCNRDEGVYRIFEDDLRVLKVDVIDNTFNSYNKIIAIEDVPEGETREPAVFYFYLLDNNDISLEPDDDVREQREKAEGLPIGSLGRRIKQVRSKIMSFSLADNKDVEDKLRAELKSEGKTDAEIEDAIQQSRAEALVLFMYNELQAPEYNLKIEIEMLNNENIKLYRNVDFVANKVVNGKKIVYNTNITKIERLNDMQVRITLGAFRNSLTDFKKKVEAEIL